MFKLKVRKNLDITRRIASLINVTERIFKHKEHFCCLQQIFF
jgi:hypothetical protein